MNVKNPGPKGPGFFSLSGKASLSRQWGLRPAARALRTHWQAEKCFLARTCRARKRIAFYFAVATAKLYEVFDMLLYDYRIFS